MLDVKWYGALYAAGGLADQPYALLRRAEAAYNVYTTIQAWRASRHGSDWREFQQKNPEQWKIVEYVLALRKANG